MSLLDLLLRIRQIYRCRECGERLGTNPECETCREFESERQTYSPM